MQVQKNLISYISQSLRDNWERPAFTDYLGPTLQYRDVARKIMKLHILFSHAGLQPGDRVAICGRNSSNWAIAALAVMTYGAVCVPILHDFKPDDVRHLVCHSEAKLFFTDTTTWKNIKQEGMKHLEGAILINDFSLLYSRNKKLTHARETLNRLFGDRYPERFRPEDVVFRPEDDDKPALINYTSGSTGNSKGVILSYGNLWSNIQFTIDGLTFLKQGDTMVCMLPLAHMFGFTVEMLHTFVKGCHIYFITRTPSPKIILGAFADVKPKLIVTVPLILDKIVRTRVFPTLDKPLMKMLLHTPIVDKKILAKVRASLITAFGGQVKQIIVGGAPLANDVETFLRRIQFPVTVGYGMTECGPLIAYSPWDVRKPGSCGRIVDRMEYRVDSEDPATIPGVLKVRGANVMKGYFHNDEATKDTFDKDGWMNTGDIVLVDPDGFITIKGRDKTMILGPSGQNIYPEEIEHKLNRRPYIAESLVVDRQGKLVALIVPDYDAASGQNLNHEALEKIIADNVAAVNTQLPAYSQLSAFEIYHDEFEKTPKRSIKRYLYK